jgi:phosphatidate cytidylyltransferase
MSKRAVTAILLLLVGFPALVLGGLLYFLFIGFLLVVAAWEYIDMFQAIGSKPSRWLVVGGVAALSAATFFDNALATPVFTLFILALLAFHLLDYERGAEHASLDFSASVGALTYIGWIGVHLFSIRQLPNGGWWFMFVLPCVWMADTGAYTLGAAYGKHRMTPRLSPKKTWEGFAAGAFTAMLAGGFFAYAYTTWGPLNLPVWEGALFGLVVGLLTPLGDLGESMIKRQAGMKDSGQIFPGHGGAFDRIDSWLWGAVLGYYFIIWFVR